MLAALLALIPTAELPAPEDSMFSYTYIEGGYVSTEVDVVDESSNGFFVGGSFSVHPNVSVVASYQDETLEVGGTDLDAFAFGAGVNVHTPVHERVDVFGQVRFLSAEAEALGVSDTETGYDLQAGVRTMPVDRFEVAAAVIHTDVFDSSTNLGIDLRGYATKSLSVSAGAILDDDGNTYVLSLRYQF